MPLFFKSQSLTSSVIPALHNALVAEPKGLSKPPVEIAADMAKQVKTDVAGTLAMGRVIAAFVLLGLIFVGGILADRHPELKRWADVLFDAFKVGLPGLIGLILGEASSRAT
jgi:hypothetical protein